jgi:hypothetical protein
VAREKSPSRSPNESNQWGEFHVIKVDDFQMIIDINKLYEEKPV